MQQMALRAVAFLSIVPSFPLIAQQKTPPSSKSIQLACNRTTKRSLECEVSVKPIPKIADAIVKLSALSFIPPSESFVLPNRDLPLPKISDDSTKFVLPESVAIPVGEESVMFVVTYDELEEDQTVAITAKWGALNWTSRIKLSADPPSPAAVARTDFSMFTGVRDATIDLAAATEVGVNHQDYVRLAQRFSAELKKMEFVELEKAAQRDRLLCYQSLLSEHKNVLKIWSYLLNGVSVKTELSEAMGNAQRRADACNKGR